MKYFMNRKIQQYGILVLFVIAFAATFLVNYSHMVSIHPWSVGDWLINYQGGFVRRGLTGEVIINLSHIFDIKPEVIVLIMQSIFYFIFYFFSYFIIKSQNSLNEYFFLIFSPFIFYFQVLDPGASGRKEIIFFALFAFLIWASIRYSSEKLEKIYYLTLLIYPLVILTHEALAIYLPYILIAFLIKFPLNKSRLFKLLILLSISLVVFILSLYYKGNSDIVMAICKSLKNTAGCYIEGGSAINSLAWSTMNGLELVYQGIKTRHYIPTYTVIMILAFVAYMPLIYKFQYIFKSKLNVYLISISSFGSILIMLVGWDWGRFIYINLVSIFLLSFLIPSKSNSWSQKYSLFILFLAFLYFISWRIPHCCGYDIFTYPFKEIIKYL